MLFITATLTKSNTFGNNMRSLPTHEGLIDHPESELYTLCQCLRKLPFKLCNIARTFCAGLPSVHFLYAPRYIPVAQHRLPSTLVFCVPLVRTMRSIILSSWT